MKIVFVPGSFDDFDGSQEELDALVNEIMEFVQSDEFLEKLDEAKAGLIDDEEAFDESDFSDFFNSNPSPTIH